MRLLFKSIEIIRKHGLKEYMQAVKLYLLLHPIIDEVWWHTNQLTRSQSRVIRNVQGNKMLLDISKKGIHKHLFLHGNHEPECTRTFKKMLPKGSRVIDIGANIGYYALMEAQVAQKVYAIEPEPQNLELLRENIKLNSCGSRIEIHELAISNTIGKTWLDISEYPNEHRLHTSSTVPQENCIEVAGTTLDEFVKDKEFDVIRMDLEGGEWFVIKGMTKILAANKPLLLFIEIHPTLIKDYSGDAMMLLEILLDSGFKIRYVAAIRPAPLFSIRPYIKARALPQEQIIEFHLPLSNSKLNKKACQMILEEKIALQLFLER